MHSLTILLAGATLAVGTAAIAQAPAPAAAAAPALAAGATVYDPTGAEAGTVDSINGDLVVVSTGTNKISMPKASFGAGAKGPMVSVTKAQIDAAASQAAAQQTAALKSALVVGASVKGSSGSPVGTVKSIAADNVVVQSAKGPVAVPLNAFSAGAGGLMIAMTAAEFETAAAAATASATPQ
ncbi:hypothetical protein KX816_12515 [Sphingosinicellaceae bacterium]|nr:hypothetical protein KX816_12515 [Sphingosinicellaceae bacterium]